MMPVHFYNPAALIGLWLVPAMAGLFVFAAVKRRRALRLFGTGGATLLSRKREAIGSCAAALLIVFALARPAWNLQEQALQESGRDVIFLLDVSRSMLAEDLHPSRLENAKTAILDGIEELSGDRIGLVLFAGSAEIRCPLTTDYDYFRMALRQASPDSVGAGGTMIAHAIERTLDKLIDPARAGMQDLVLITDGEDLIEGPDETDAARQLDNAGVRLIAIGIGDRSRGSRITQENEETGAYSFMKHGKAEVWTKLHSETLRRMVGGVEDGIYFDVATGPFNFAHIYRQVMEHAPRTATGSRIMERYEEKFHLFLIAAVIALLLAHRWRPGGATVALCVLFACGTAGAAPANLFKTGSRAYAEGRFPEAITTYLEAAAEAPESAEIRYNLGNAQYRTAAFAEAAGSFEHAASMAATETLRSRCWYNLGNCMVKTAEELRATDPAAAVTYCRQAVWSYRMALDCDSSLADAAHNLETVQLIAAGIEEEIRRKEAQEKQQNELTLYLHEKLEEFIRRQNALIEADISGEPQRLLEKETRELAKVMESSGLHDGANLPDGTNMPAPLQETYEHTVKAAEAMAVPDQPKALTELIAALQAVPQDPAQSDEDSETGENYDMDYSESEEDAGEYEDADPFGDFSEYEEIRGVPPPNQSEMDILTEELRNQERRKKKKAGEYKAVEKDW